VRIAPSPTGYLHIGTARTALFNWLFARHHGGKFVLRIEDTDLERSDKKYEKDIIEGLEWLGISWDEGPYRQSERLDTYEKYINKLLADGLAYYCFCTKEELDEQRQMMLAQGLAPKYNRKCAALSESEVKERLQSGTSSIIRFRIPETTVSFKDLIRGSITFDGTLIGDVAIAKDPRTPLYNFAVAVDDEEMRITHVIRGEDHIANTPKQIFLQKALGFRQPEYAHLPLILDPDRAKMSKRYSATAISEYRREGYLPEALVNFIALLGWHSKEDKEIMAAEELVKEFDLSRVQKAGAVFNIEKLGWLNAQYIKKLDAEELAKHLELAPTEDNLKIIELTRERMRKLTDFKTLAWFFFELPEYDAGLLIWKETSQKTILENLQKAKTALAALAGTEFAKSDLEKTLMPIAQDRGRGEVLWPLRVALSGQEASPGPFEIAEALGQKETLRRVELAIKKLG